MLYPHCLGFLLAASFHSPTAATHHITQGLRRRPGDLPALLDQSQQLEEEVRAGCNWQCYLDNNPDLQAKYGEHNIHEAAKHYRRHGQAEGRQCACTGSADDGDSDAPPVTAADDAPADETQHIPKVNSLKPPSAGDGHLHIIQSKWISNDGWMVAADKVLKLEDDASTIQQQRQQQQEDEQQQQQEDEQQQESEKCEIVFAETQQLPWVRSELLQRRRPYVLLTANNVDELAGRDEELLDSSQLRGWWGTAPGAVHTKFHPIPLGPKWYFESTDFLGEETAKQHSALRSAVKTRSNIGDQKERLLYAKFRVTSDITAQVVEHRGTREQCVAALLENKLLDQSSAEDVGQPSEPEDTYKQMAQSTFTISPPGNGPDTHRTWEALMLHSIPIVLSYEPLNPLYKNLPVVVVEKWEDVTEELLREKHKEFSAQKWDLQQAESRFYWIEQMQQACTDGKPPPHKLQPKSSKATKSKKTKQRHETDVTTQKLQQKSSKATKSKETKQQHEPDAGAYTTVDTTADFYSTNIGW